MNRTLLSLTAAVGLSLGSAAQAMDAKTFLTALAVTAGVSHVRGTQPQASPAYQASKEQQEIFTQTLQEYKQTLGTKCTNGSLIFLRPSDLDAATLAGNFQVTYLPAAHVISSNLLQSRRSVEQVMATFPIIKPLAFQSQEQYRSAISLEYVRKIELYRDAVNMRLASGADPITGLKTPRK